MSRLYLIFHRYLLYTNPMSVAWVQALFWLLITLLLLLFAISALQSKRWRRLGLAEISLAWRGIVLNQSHLLGWWATVSRLLVDQLWHYEVLLYCAAALPAIQRVIELLNLLRISRYSWMIAGAHLAIDPLLECFSHRFLKLDLFLNYLHDFFREIALLLGC
jgi:hypothetical protein